MSDYTVEEINRAVEGEEGDYGEENWDELGYGDNVTVTLRGERVELVYVTGKSPSEGGGEDVYAVFKAGDQFFRKSGYYASYDGANWDGAVREVRPVTREVTFYE